MKRRFKKANAPTQYQPRMKHYTVIINKVDVWPEKKKSRVRS